MNHLYFLIIFNLFRAKLFIQNVLPSGFRSQRVKNQFGPKEIIDGMMNNLVNEDHFLINANETFEQAYQRLIADCDYYSALKVAKKFDLDTDLIYKSIWQNNLDISIDLINECLSKITDQYFLLNQCVNRVPGDLKVSRFLLDYGLDVVKNLSSSLAYRNKLIENENHQNDKFESVENELRDSKLITASDAKKFMQQLRHHIDRLNLFERILNCTHSKENRFDPNQYRLFREKSIFQIAIEFAQKADVSALNVLFESKKNILSRFHLIIVSNLPETLSPLKYKHLIEKIFVSIGSDYEKLEDIYEWLDHKKYEEEFFSSNNHLCRFEICSPENIENLLTDWFDFRAREILQNTWIVDHSLDLLTIGIEHRLPLLDLFADFDLYSFLIYYQTKTRIEFDRFEKLEIREKSNLLLKEKEDIRLIVQFFQEFFEKLQNYIELKRLNVTRKELLRSFFEALTEIDFELCLKIFQTYTIVDRSPEELENLRILNDPNYLIELALHCLNCHNDPEQISIAFNLIECLPDRDQTQSLMKTRENQNDREKSEKVAEFEQLNKEIDEMEYLLSIIEALNEYNNRLTIKLLNEITFKSKHQKIVFIERIVHNFCKNVFNEFNEYDEISDDDSDDEDKESLHDEWKIFFLNLKDLKKKFMTDITDEELVKIIVKCLLLSSRKRLIELAFNHIDFQSNDCLKRLNCFEGTAILKQAAKDYIKFTSSLNDASLRFARICLELVKKFNPNDMETNQDLDFLEALQIMKNEFLLEILPIKITNMSDQSLLDLILSSSINAHTKKEKILTVCNLLRMFQHIKSELDRESSILVIIGSKSIDRNDYKTAIEICEEILDRDLHQGWKLCYQICLLPKIDSLITSDEHLHLISFVLTHCPTNDIAMHYNLLRLIRKIKKIHYDLQREQKIYINFHQSRPISKKTVDG